MTRSFASCTRQACEPDRLADPNGWCQHDHQAWAIASSPTLDEWIGHQVDSETAMAAIEEDRLRGR